jgi:SagB-type dehydrogenase family enzyme
MTQGIGREFMHKTYYRYLEQSDQRKGLPQPPLELGYDETKPVIDLPAPAEIEVAKCELREAIENRRSVRRYAKQPLTLAELSYLLWCTQGVREVAGSRATLRMVPSAGARHAFETYLLVNNVEGLQPGLYRFLAIEHKLVAVDLGASIADGVTAAAWDQQFIKASAVTFIWTAVAYRMMWRYAERGYRYMHLDAGHVCQNLYLAAAAIQGGVCAVAAFDDEAMNRLLDIDGDAHFAIYLAAVGKRQSKEP